MYVHRFQIYVIIVVFLVLDMYYFHVQFINL